MKDSLKRLGIKRGSALALAITYAIVPLTFLKGNPTGLIWTHDHAARYIRVNSIDLDNHKVAGYKVNEAVLKESRLSHKIQDYRIQLMFLEGSIERVQQGNYQDKEAKMRNIEKRIERLYDKIDSEGIRLEDIQSQTNGYMVAWYQ